MRHAEQGHVAPVRPRVPEGVGRGVVSIRWAAWYGDRDLCLPFPPRWEIELAAPSDSVDIGDEGIRGAIDRPIGVPPLRVVARGRHRPCIVVDDLTRPTPASRIIPLILVELAAAGIPAESVTILAAVGNHRPMRRQDFVKKVGAGAVSTCRLRSHSSLDDCVYVGKTERGTPVSLNRDLVTADLRILVGSVLPHEVPGFSGGAKLILPGAASIETAAAFHGPGGPATALATTAPDARLDAEDAAQLVGVDFAVNIVPTPTRGVAGAVAGDLVQAHRAAVSIARRTYSTVIPPVADVCVLSAYPKDTEFLQYENVYNVWRTADRAITHENGTVVVATAASEGIGFHSLAGPGMRLASQASPREAVAPRNLMFYSPGANRGDLPDAAASEGVEIYQDWQPVVAQLLAVHGDRARAVVFPCAPVQIAECAAHQV